MPREKSAGDWKVRIDDMLEAAARAMEYTEGITFDAFASDRLRLDAVARNVEIFGEAARYVPTEVREKYPLVPWSRIVGLRNIVAHDYFAVNLSIIWDTVKNDLPPTVPLLQEILEKEP